MTQEPNGALVRLALAEYGQMAEDGLHDGGEMDAEEVRDCVGDQMMGYPAYKALPREERDAVLAEAFPDGEYYGN